MFNVMIEVGGIGTGQVIFQHPFFGWQYRDGLNGLDDISLKDLHEHDPKIYRMIMDRVPQAIRDEILEATKVEPKSTEPIPVVEVKVEPPKPKRWQRGDGIPQGYENDLEDEDVAPILEEWGGGPKASGEFSDFCNDVLHCVSPADELRRISKDRDEGCGWTADIMCCAWMRKQEALNNLSTADGFCSPGTTT